MSPAELLATISDADLRAEANRRGYQLNSEAFSTAAADCLRLADKLHGDVETLRQKVLSLPYRAGTP